MVVWPRLHTALAVTLVPMLAVAPAFGAGALALWAALARPRRSAPSQDLAVLLAAVVAAVAMVHGRSWDGVVWPLLGATALAAAIVRLDAAASRGAAIAIGLGSAATAAALAGAALGETLANGFDQVATASHHPNATAAMALGLAAASALAFRGDWRARSLGAAGIVSSLGLIVLTGSRGGLVGVAISLAIGLALAGGLALARAGRERLGVLTAGAIAVVLLATTQAFLLTPDLWTSLAPVNALARASEASESVLLDRVARLTDPLGTSGGRAGAWTFARELIAHRPFLGYGMTAITNVYAPTSSSEFRNALVHPHHGVLAMLLQGGALYAVAVLALLTHFGVRLVRCAVRGDAAAAIAAAALSGLFVAEMLDSVARTGQVGGPMVLAVVVAAATARRTEPRTQPDGGLDAGRDGQRRDRPSAVGMGPAPTDPSTPNVP